MTSPSSGARCRCGGRPTRGRAPATWSRKRCSARCARAGRAGGSACRCSSSSGARRLRRTARRSVAQVAEEVVAVREALRQREAHVVGVERVRHHQVRHRLPSVFAPAARTAGRRRSSRCRTRSRPWSATRRRVFGLSRPVYQPSGRCAGQSLDDLRPRAACARARSPRRRSGSGSSASRGRRSRGRVRRRRQPPRDGARAPSPRRRRSAAGRGARTRAGCATRRRASRTRRSLSMRQVARREGRRVEQFGEELLASRRRRAARCSRRPPRS